MYTSIQTMRRRRAIMVALVLIVAVAHGFAQSGGGFDLSWNTVAGGGISAGGTFKLAQVVGQVATGAPLAGGDFTHQPGFLQDSDYFPVPVTISRFQLD